MSRGKNQGGPQRKADKNKTHASMQHILRIVHNGAVVMAGLMQRRNQLRFMDKHWMYESDFQAYYPSSVSRQITKLWRKGYVTVHETSDGIRVEITDKGKKKTLQYDLDSIRISVQEPWDRKWRMVMFDIPNTHKKHIRHQLLALLKSMEFFKMQQSVYVHPYPCKEQIQYLREVLDIPHCIKYVVVEQVENDEDLRDVFQLL